MVDVLEGNFSLAKERLRIKRAQWLKARDESSMKSKLTIAGLLIGSVVGFLLRPSVPLMGQLPFTTVVTRGANLRGLDQLLLGYARTSFNYLIAGMVIGTIVGLIAAFVIPSQES